MPESTSSSSTASSSVTLALAWLGVGLPLLWGVYQTLAKTLALFR